MRTIAVACRKGGSGKTTTSVNLAAALAESGRSVLLVDVDPQHTLSSWIGDPSDDWPEALLAKSPALPAVQTETELLGVHLLAGSERMTAVEREMMDPTSGPYRLAAALRETRSAYDYCLIDCPPAASYLTLGALIAADCALVPILASGEAVTAITQTLQLVEVAQEMPNPSLSVLGIWIAEQAPNPRTRLPQELREVIDEEWPGKTFTAAAPHSVRFRECFPARTSILGYEPKSKAADAYRALAREVVDRMKETTNA